MNSVSISFDPSDSDSVQNAAAAFALFVVEDLHAAEPVAPVASAPPEPPTVEPAQEAKLNGDLAAECRALMARLAGELNCHAQAKAILTRFGLTKLGEVEPGQLAAIRDAVQADIAKVESGAPV